ATVHQEGGVDLYHARRNVAPELTFVIAKPLTVSVVAVSVKKESGTPGNADQSANALTAAVRYNREFEDAGFQQQFGGSYSLRAGTRGLGSDYAYSRHMFKVRYEIRSGKQLAREEFLGGMIAGYAPMFERFVLGSS